MKTKKKLMAKVRFFPTQEMRVHVGKCTFMHVNCWEVFIHLYQQNADLLHLWNLFGDKYEGIWIYANFLSLAKYVLQILSMVFDLWHQE